MMTTGDLWAQFLLFLASCGCMQERKAPPEVPIIRNEQPRIPIIPFAEEADWEWDFEDSDSDAGGPPIAQEADLFGIFANAAHLMI